MSGDGVRLIITLIGLAMLAPFLYQFWLGVFWYRIKFWFLYAAVSYVPEEYCPRWLLLWHAREDFRVCRFLGENIESRYLIARDNARYL